MKMPSDNHLRFMQGRTLAKTYDTSTRVKRKRVEVQLPEVIPGEFIVIEYDRDTECFTMITDGDVEVSSYDLGRDVSKIMLYFRLVKLSDIGNRTVDAAKEFGAAQGILSDGRVIPLFASQLPAVDIFKESVHAYNLPRL